MILHSLRDRARPRSDTADAARPPGRRRLGTSLLQIGIALALALGLPAVALAFSFGTQAVLLPQPQRHMLLASKELKLLSHRKIVQADITLGRQHVRTLCLQGWTQLRGRRLGVPNQIVIASAGWQAAIAQTAPHWHRLGSRQILSPRRSVIAQLAGCPHLLVIRIARAIDAERLHMWLVRQRGSVAFVYRLALGKFHGTSLYLDVRRRDLKPLAVVSGGEFGHGVARIRISPKPRPAALRRKELALIRLGTRARAR